VQQSLLEHFDSRIGNLQQQVTKSEDTVSSLQQQVTKSEETVRDLQQEVTKLTEELDRVKGEIPAGDANCESPSVMDDGVAAGVSDRSTRTGGESSGCGSGGDNEEEEENEELWDVVKVVDKCSKCCGENCNGYAALVWQSMNDSQGDDVYPLCVSCCVTEFGELPEEHQHLASQPQPATKTRTPECVYKLPASQRADAALEEAMIECKVKSRRWRFKPCVIVCSISETCKCCTLCFNAIVATNAPGRCREHKAFKFNLAEHLMDR